MDDLVTRLREKWCGHYGMDEKHLVNPDGPEAADALEAQAAELAKLRAELAAARNVVTDAIEIIEEQMPGEFDVWIMVARAALKGPAQ
jgi:hypothetical protein